MSCISGNCWSNRIIAGLKASGLGPQGFVGGDEGGLKGLRTYRAEGYG